MKFYKLCDLTLNEMARAAKSVQFGKVKVNPIEVTPDKVTNIKMYLLDQFDDSTKADIFNKIISNFKDQQFDNYDDLYNFVAKQVSEGIKEQGGKQNSTQLKYTTRVVFNTLGPNRLKVLVPIESTPGSPDSTESSSDSSDKVREGNKGIFVLSNDNFLEFGIDKLQSFPPSILDPITVFFQDHDGEKIPEMKLRVGLIDAVKEGISGLDEDLQDRIMARLQRDNMSELMIKLKGSKSLMSPGKTTKKSEEEIVPVFDPEESEPEEILSADVERLTGGYRPERDYDFEKEFGVDFG
jgi:hypothetical protein